jgi:2-methylcitrate dehydratase PrpD
MIIKELSKFIVNLNYENIPQTAINKAKLCFIDYLGVTMRGFNEDVTQIAIKSIENLHSLDNLNKSNNGKSSIIGNGYSNIANAGFFNAISAHALDLDDGHRFAQVHPGSVVFSTALAISEANNINGEKFLDAVVCGYEIAIILGNLANPYHRNQGFHSTGTIGTFVSGAVAAKLLNLNIKETIIALGLCGTQSSGLLESDHKGTMGKQLHVGKAVYNGILSAYLAKNGFTGAESIIDGDEGFLKSTAIDLFKNLNENNIDFNNYLSSYLKENIAKFHINDVYFKKYPFCRHLHSSIDASLNLRNKYNFNIEDIEKIIIKTYKIAAEHDNFNPKNKEEIKQSLAYAVAIALAYEDINLDIIEDSINKKKCIKNILNKIVIGENK